MSEPQNFAAEYWRLFIAIAVPEEVKSAMAGWQSRLREAAPAAEVSRAKRAPAV